MAQCLKSLLLPDRAPVNLQLVSKLPIPPTKKHDALLTDAHGVPVFDCPKISWQTAMLLMVRGAIPKEFHEGVMARTVNGAYRVPSVVCWPDLAVQTNVVPTLNIHRLFERDFGICAYTGVKLKIGSNDPAVCATIEHIIPVSRGGENSWNNVVLASFAINNLKADKTPEEFGMPLRFQPWTPTLKDFVALLLYRERQFYAQSASITAPVAPRAAKHFDKLKPYLYFDGE